MGRAKILAPAAAIAAIAIIAAFSPQLPQGTGLFGLPAGEGREALRPGAEEKNPVQAGLSFTALKPTTIEAQIVGQGALPECPKEAIVEIRVKNTGKSDAEKVFLKFGPGIKVLGCANCGLESLKGGQEEAAKARLCLESRDKKMLVAGSANSNKVEIMLE
jgi:hypothetical protein